nr:ATP-binding cassette domain-containing protein [Micromonospora sp. DSM 115978]
HNLFTPINIALALVDEAQKATASLARLVGVAQLPDVALDAGLDTGHDDALDVPAARAPSADGPTPTPAAASAISVHGVRHAYVAGNDVLHDVTLAVPAGATVALVGSSGAGKTTLAKIIKGVHRPTAGAVTIGGVDLTDLDAATLRKSVFLVTQEVHVFA